MSTAEHDRRVDCEVAIIGLGPVGLALAGLLGERGVDVIAIDPTHEPFPYPRAIAADDETLRTLVRLPGIDQPLRLFDEGQRVEVRDTRGRLVTTVSFEASPLGVPGLSFFHQPSLERAMRAALRTHESVTVRWGARLLQMQDSPGGIRLRCADGPSFTAAWVVGCDGAASAVRRARRIAYTGRTFAEPWIVVDIDSPEPLGHLPYFTYVLDRARPSVNMPRPGGHRFEFMLLPGEDAAQMAQRAQVDRWLEPYLAPLDRVRRSRLRIVRSAGYAYHARTAARWRDGRVLLAGDAAHCMPPFGGQGLGAGIGDALALAWRLDEVTRGIAPAGLLDDYERERQPRVAEMTRTALVAGRLLTATSAPAATATRLALGVMDATPLLGSRFRAGSLRARPRVPSPGDGHPRAGEPLPNPRVRTRRGRVTRLDDVLPAGWALLGNGTDPWQDLPATFSVALQTRSCRCLVVVAPGGLSATSDLACPAVEDLDGGLLALWKRRPWSRHHVDGAPIALIRPDRFLAGVSNGAALADAFARLTHAEPPSPSADCLTSACAGDPQPQADPAPQASAAQPLPLR